MITVLWGPPCSGKSTYIAQRARPGDVIIDLDRIALALTTDTTHHHEYGEPIRVIAQAARRAAIDAALADHGPGDLWVIDSGATHRKRAWWRTRHHATVIELDTPLEVCLERARAERPAWGERRVREWFDKFAPTPPPPAPSRAW